MIYALDTCSIISISDPEFKSRYDRACADVLCGITNQLKEQMSTAIVTIVEIMNTPKTLQRTD